jgi:hypothetical protein
MVVVSGSQTLPQRIAPVRSCHGATGPSGGAVELVLTSEIVVVVDELARPTSCRAVVAGGIGCLAQEVMGRLTFGPGGA